MSDFWIGRHESAILRFRPPRPADRVIWPLVPAFVTSMRGVDVSAAIQNRRSKIQNQPITHAVTHRSHPPRHDLHLRRPRRAPRHRLHLRPVHDWRQSVISHTLDIRPRVPTVEYEDVFGNRATRFEITQPYTELRIAAESVVEVKDVDPFAFADLPIRPPSFPLVWMPWERTMLAPYLTPAELPDTQLQELCDYGMNFVRRNNGDLMETLFAINLELYRDYQYTPHSTDLGTTAYQVYCSGAGRLPGLRQPVHHDRPPARHPGPLRLRLPPHRQHRPDPRHERRNPRLGPALHPEHRLEGLRPDQRRPPPDRPRPRRHRPTLPRRHPDRRDHLRQSSRIDARGRGSGRRDPAPESADHPAAASRDVKGVSET